MKIRIDQSGGFAGIQCHYEMESDKLPPSLKDTARDLLDGTKSLMTMSSTPKGSADYQNYKITIQNGKKNRVIECNEFQMNDNVKSLVRYLQSNSNK